MGDGRRRMKEIYPGMYLLPKEGGMRVEGLVVANERLLEEIGKEPLDQVKNVAYLPGICGYSIAMPDIHWGYGFPIGGVAAMDVEEGVISPGGVGYDINCGVRLAVLPMPFKSLSGAVKDDLLKELFGNIPSGVGQGRKEGGLSKRDWDQLVHRGAKWALDQGYGLPQDLDATESKGVIEGADLEAVSDYALQRGSHQIGSIGSGNHFVEIGEVAHIDDEEIARMWDIREGETYIMIHSGSRGFGHQVCQDTLDRFMKKGYAKGLPDNQLVATPLKSKDGEHYFAAMACAANFAFNNRQRILHSVRRSFKNILGIKEEEIRQIYDVCHNIAKIEEYEGKSYCVHRKGATRAFGPGHKELASQFQQSGQPVIIPGDMGRASYLMAGLGNPHVWHSCCHGAGRARSRVQSRKRWSGEDPVRYMHTQGVEVMASSRRTIDEEMPDAYKDVIEVVNAAEHAGLAKKIAFLKPKLVIKG